MRAAVVIFALTLSACASNPGGYKSVDEVQGRLTGMPEGEIAEKLGAPTQSATLSDGSTVWTYRSRAMGVTGGECTVSLTMREGKVVRAFVTKSDLSPLTFPLGSCKNILGNLD
jgi:hypothetical protein